MVPKTLCLIILTVLSLGNCENNIEEERHDRYAEGEQNKALAKLVRMRCTRRFSPGVCANEVSPVWTFVFLAQNCTERLGCPNNYRSNRFRSYRTCMRRCRPLVDIYLKMVEYQERNSTGNRTDGMGSEDYVSEDDYDDGDKNVTVDASGMDMDEGNYTDDMFLREHSTKHQVPTRTRSRSRSRSPIPTTTEDLSQEFEEEEYYEEDQQSNTFIVYKDTDINEDIMVPDVDYVSGEIRSEFDMLRW